MSAPEGHEDPGSEHSAQPGHALARPITPGTATAIAERLRILGAPVRVRLVDVLDRDGEQSVGGLASTLGETARNVSQHLAVLRAAHVVQGRHLPDSAGAAPLSPV